MEYSCIYRFIANNGSGTPTAQAYLKYKRFTITTNGVVVFDGIPALDANDKPCFYDTVSQTPFYNAGTGEFLYGNVR